MELERLFRELVKAIRASDPSRLHQPHRLKDVQFHLVPYRSVRHILNVECSEDHEMLLLRLCSGEGDYFTVADPDAREAFSAEATSINPDLGLLEVYGDIDIMLKEQAISRSAVELEPESAYRPPHIAPAPEPDHTPAEEHPGQHDATGETRVIPMQQDSAPSSAAPVPPPILEPTQLDVPPPPPPRLPEPEPPGKERASSVELSPQEEPAATAPAAPDPPGCAYCGGSLPIARQINFCPHCGQNLSVIRCAQCAAELEYGWHHCIACGHPVPED